MVTMATNTPSHFSLVSTVSTLLGSRSVSPVHVTLMALSPLCVTYTASVSVNLAMELLILGPVLGALMGCTHSTDSAHVSILLV